MRLFQATRGQSSAKTAVVLIVAIAVAMIVAAVMAPVAINEIESDDTTTLTQNEEETYDVNGALTSNVTNVDGTNNQATVELNDTRTTSTTSNTISVGSTESYDLDGGTVNVTVDSVDTSPSPNTATVTYEYDKDYAYSDGASSLWGILGLAVVLTLVLYGVGMAIKQI